MGETKEGYGSSWVLTVLFTALAFFVYGQSLPFMLAFLLLGVLSSIMVLVSFVPFGVGGVLVVLGLKYWVYLWVLSVAGLYERWLTSLLFWFDSIIGFMLSILITVALLQD